MGIGRILMWMLRIVLYGALLIAVCLLGLLLIIGLAGVCPRFDTGAISCVSTFWESMARLAMSYLLLAVFTGFPILLALGGLILLVVDFIRWAARRV